jgi:hypothetical protein
MTVDNDPPERPDISMSMELSHEAMMERWRQGLVTPMSATIDTFAKTDGSWWTVSPTVWLRVRVTEHNERLDFHHARFTCLEQAGGPAAKRSRWHRTRLDMP